MSSKLQEASMHGTGGFLKVLHKLRVSILLIVITFVAVGAIQALSIFLGNHLSFLPSHSDKPHYVFSLNDYLHLAIPIAVLVMEFYVILKMAQESYERTKTVEDFREMTSRSRRAEYLLDLASAISRIKSEARFTSATMEVSTRSEGQRQIIDAVRSRKKEGDYTHRGLIARTQKTLPGVIELAIQAPHIEIRLSEVVALSRFRFFVRDRQESVLGVAEGQPDLADAKESTQSSRVNSRMLAESLEVQFDNLWKTATPIKDYIDEILRAAAPVTKSEVRTWFSSVKCESKDLDKALGENSTVFASLDEGNS